QPFQRGRIAVVVPAEDPLPGIARCGEDRRLVAFWQFIPLGEVDEVMGLPAAFPPTRIVVVLRDLVEAEFLVIVRPDPFAGVEGTFLERRIDVATGELLGHSTQFRENGASKSTDAHLKSLSGNIRRDYKVFGA